jgi:hypothetical protein
LIHALAACVHAKLIDSPELEVMFWELDVYWNPQDPDAPPILIPLQAIRCQLARARLEMVEPELWATTTLERVSPLCTLLVAFLG